MATPTLISVVSITATGVANVYQMQIELDFDGTHSVVPFGLTPDDMAPLSIELRQWMIDHDGEYTILPFVEPPPVAYSFRVETLWSRLTDEEAEDFDTASATASPLKMRKQFQVATSMMSDGDLFAWLKALLTTLFGAERAEELLAEDMMRGDGAETAPSL